MTTQAKQKHIHKYTVDRYNVGVCKCGRLVQFMAGSESGALKDEKYKVLREGDPNYVDPAPDQTPTVKKVITGVRQPIPKKPEGDPAFHQVADTSIL